MLPVLLLKLEKCLWRVVSLPVNKVKAPGAACWSVAGQCVPTAGDLSTIDGTGPVRLGCLPRGVYRPK